MATTPIGSAGTLAQGDFSSGFNAAPGDYIAFLKEFYQGTVVADLVYKNHPWLGLVPKNPEVRGTVYPKPVKYANIVGQSALYATAHENQAPAQRQRWELTHIDNYAKATVSNKVIELSLGNPAAFREALTESVDSAYSAFANDVDFEILAKFDNGARAAVVSKASTVIQLGGGEARFFEVGMKVQHTDALDHTTLIAEVQIVTAVDRVLDKVTLDFDFTTDALAAGDRLYREGDFEAKAASLPGWIPGTSVTSTAWFGINRTVDTRLAGITAVQGTGTAAPYLKCLVDTGAILYKEGSSPDICLLNPVDHAALAFETETRGARYVNLGATSGGMSYSALSVMTGAGECPVVAAPALAEDTVAMGERSAVELFSAGGLPRMFKKDGSFYHREEGADTLAFYLFGYYNQVVQSPIKWAYRSDIVA